MRAHHPHKARMVDPNCRLALIREWRSEWECLRKRYVAAQLKMRQHLVERGFSEAEATEEYPADFTGRPWLAKPHWRI